MRLWNVAWQYSFWRKLLWTFAIAMSVLWICRKRSDDKDGVESDFSNVCIICHIVSFRGMKKS